MGGFGSRGGVFLMAPVKRRIPSDTLPVWVSKSGLAHSSFDPGADPQGSSRWEDYFETLYADDANSGQSSEPRSEP